MISPMLFPDIPVPPGDNERVHTLNSYQLDGPVPESEFDNIVQQAVDTFDVPIALISFVEKERQFFKARIGFPAPSTPRKVSFCTHTLMSDDVLVVPDARADARFADNPLVTGDPFIRFYADAPIIAPGGHRLGAVCIIDTEPRPPWTDRETAILKGLARIVVDQLEHRRLALLSRAAMSMASASPDAILCADDAGRITFWNEAAEKIFDIPPGRLFGSPLAMLFSDEEQAHHHAWMRAVLADDGASNAKKAIEIHAQRGDGTRFPVEVSAATWMHGDRRNVGTIIRDLSERENARQSVRYLTHFDRLTELPNRVAFVEQTDRALRTVGRFSLFKVGLDRFKLINGTMGISTGDLVLVEAAKRVRQAAGPNAFTARLAGDEFGILLAGSDDPILADVMAERVLRHLEQPFHIGSSTHHLGASVGVVLYPGLSEVETADAALKGALLALQHAKAEGGRCHIVFTPQLGRQAEDRRWLEDELRGAFARNEFELHFQPQVTLPDARVMGCEALLRWRHPVHGLLSPAKFLPVLEASAVALDVGRWIIDRACSFAADLAARGFPIRVGVNLFAAQLRDRNFYDDIAAALAGTGLPSELLELEITETTVLDLDHAAIEPLRALRARGIGIAFDDYGTGYASLSLLKRYPLTRLKIDREFVQALETDPDDGAIVRAVIALGASLNLEVIAEGIETARQAEILFGYGCVEAQGYRFGKPMSDDEFASRLTAGQLSAAA